MSRASDSVTYAACLSPRTIYRVVIDDDGSFGYQATPESPGWTLAHHAVDLVAQGANAGIVPLSRVEAMFLIHLWGGRRDVLDDPNAAPPPPPAVTEDTVEPALERADVFRTLRDMGRVLTHKPGDIRVIRSARDPSTPIEPDLAGERSDLHRDEAPLARPLFHR